MSLKAWLIPMLSTFTGIGFTIFSFYTGEVVTESQIRLLDYLLVMTLGSGAIGATKKGFKEYQAYKSIKEDK